MHGSDPPSAQGEFISQASIAHQFSPVFNWVEIATAMNNLGQKINHLRTIEINRGGMAGS